MQAKTVMLHNAASGFVPPKDVLSSLFEEMTSLPCLGFNSLTRARRYGRWWLLKGLKEEYRNQQLYQTLLRKEFDLLITLQHPNIVSAATFENVENLGPCIVMEWVDGQTLADWLQTERTLAERLALLHELLDALRYIHGKQLVHRDVKPSNIMVTHNGHHVKLIDFGLADASSFAILKQPAGTEGFMSPEQAHERKADQRNDIYSVGCVMELLHLGRPYQRIVKRCKAPIADRYASVEELRHAVDNAHSIRAKGWAIGGILILIAFVAVIYNTYGVGGDAIGSHNKPQETASSEKKIDENNQEKEVRSKSNVKTLQEESRIETEKKNAANQNKSAASLLQQEKAQHRNNKTKDLATMIAEGKRQIDQLWKETNVEGTDDISEQSLRFIAFCKTCNDFIIRDYLATLPSTLSASECTSVEQTLSSYMADRYVRPTLQRFEAAQP